VLREAFKAAAVPGAVRIIGNNAALVKGKRGVGDNKVRIKLQPGTKAGTAWAGPKGVVKRKKTRLQFRNRNAAVGTGVFLGKEILMNVFGGTIRTLAQYQ